MKHPGPPANTSSAAGASGLRPGDRWCAAAWSTRPALVWGAQLVAVALSLATCTAAHASDTRDHERARAAVQAGEVLPLPALLERLQRSHPGQVLELELEREDGRWVYEVKLLQSNGQLLKLLLDARTGQLLQAKRKDDRKDERSSDGPRERERERYRDKDRDRKPEPAGPAPR